MAESRRSRQPGIAVCTVSIVDRGCAPLVLNEPQEVTSMPDLVRAWELRRRLGTSSRTSLR